MSNIIQNAIYIPSRDLYLVSTHGHDFQADHVTGCGCDGGRNYLRRIGEPTLMREWSVVDTDSDLKKHHRLLWGTRGKEGRDPLKFVPISTLELSHLRAIIANCPDISIISRETILYWIVVRDRYENDLIVKSILDKTKKHVRSNPKLLSA